MSLDLAALFATYHGPLVGYLTSRCRDRHLADDLASTVWVRVAERGHQWQDRGQPIGAWLMTIARNLLLDHRRNFYTRRVHSHAPVGESWDAPDPDPVCDPPRMVESREIAEVLGVAIAGLSEPQREVVRLRYVDGRCNQETADLLGIDPTAVKARTYRARQSLSGMVPASLVRAHQ